MFRRLKIKWKIIVLIMATSMSSILLVSSAFVLYRVSEIRQTMLDDYRTRAMILAKNVMYPVSFNDNEEIREVLRELEWWPNIDYAAVYDNERNVIVAYHATHLNDNFKEPQPDTKGHYFTRNHLVYFQPVYLQQERIGIVCLQANLAPMHKVVSESLVAGCLAVVFAGLLAFFLASYFQRFISKPIKEITEAAREVTNHKDYLLRLPNRSSDELGSLTEEFNLMLRKIQARDRALVEAKERLELNSRELAEHRDHLEKLVEERTAHLRSAYDEIRAFVFMFSHDLRTPLVNIKGFTGELRYTLEQLTLNLEPHLSALPAEASKEIGILLRQEVPESLTYLEGAASSMDRLINAMLKLSFLGRRELHFRILSPRELINRILDEFGAQLHQLRIDVHIGKLPDVMADAEALEQIFQQVIQNAIAYLDPDRNGRIDIWGEQGDEVVFLYIRDNGRGIEPKDIPRIFEPFRRIGEQPGEGEAGQGMGLVYAKTLVHRHGGKIWCTSKPGIGTTFTFTLAHQPGVVAYSPLGT